jgi:hypothetical protein
VVGQGRESGYPAYILTERCPQRRPCESGNDFSTLCLRERPDPDPGQQSKQRREGYTPAESVGFRGGGDNGRGEEDLAVLLRGLLVFIEHGYLRVESSDHILKNCCGDDAAGGIGRLSLKL